MDVTGSLGSSVMSGSKGSGTASHQFSAANTTNTAYADEFDTSVATLNTVFPVTPLKIAYTCLQLFSDHVSNWVFGCGENDKWRSPLG